MGKLIDFASVLLSRINLANQAGKTFEGKRDLYETLGYKRTLLFQDYYDRYKRGGIARRIVNAYPNATWRNAPKIVSENEEFVRIWEELTVRLKLFHYLNRLDTLSGIETFGTLLIGTKSARALDQPIGTVSSAKDVLYLSVFTEDHSQISKIEADPGSERFGLPAEYMLTLTTDATGGTTVSKPTHHSRLIHVAEDLDEDEIHGTPRQRAVWNYLDDMDKISGASAEAIWRVADRGIQFDMDPETELKPEDEEALSNEIEEYMHDMKRHLMTQGIKANVLGGETVDPRGAYITTMGLISGTTGIPQRILSGSEAGQLASSQDERNFNARVRERQEIHAEPNILRPTVDKFIEIGALPDSPYDIEWPDLAVLTRKEEADIAARFGQAIKHASDQKSEIITPQDFIDQFLKLDIKASTKPDAEPEPILAPGPESEDDKDIAVEGEEEDE